LSNGLQSSLAPNLVPYGLLLAMIPRRESPLSARSR
jgi:hypothetical protein